jgi:3-hydroxymyristoyl/3-hydroxydecanoyl-(acyl carrier protein) dehydratase
MTPPPAFDIPADHPAFAGHFPGRPILPGVVLLDAALSPLETAGEIDLAHCYLRSVKFQGTVGPGDRLQGEYEWLAQGSIRFTLSVRQSVRESVGDRVVLTGTVMAAPPTRASNHAL